MKKSFNAGVATLGAIGVMLSANVDATGMQTTTSSTSNNIASTMTYTPLPEMPRDQLPGTKAALMSQKIKNYSSQYKQIVDTLIEKHGGKEKVVEIFKSILSTHPNFDKLSKPNQLQIVKDAFGKSKNTDDDNSLLTLVLELIAIGGGMILISRLKMDKFYETLAIIAEAQNNPAYLNTFDNPRNYMGSTNYMI